jgi:hypothetical protein
MTQAHDPKFPQSTSGSWYPKNYVVGVIDDFQEAQQAQKAFQAAGHPAEELRLMSSEEATHKVEKLEEEKNPFQRFFSFFQGVTDETGAHVYEREARQGNHILYVRAENEEESKSIAALMQRYHAHTVKYFGPWAVADLPPQSTTEP